MPKSNLGRKLVTAGLSLVLSVGGVIAPVTTAWAAGSNDIPQVHATASTTVEKGTTFSVTMDNAKPGAKYKLIQLMTGSFYIDAEGADHIGDIECASDGVRSRLVAALQVADDAAVDTANGVEAGTIFVADDYKALTTDSARDNYIADAIAKLGSNTAAARTFANYLGSGMQDNAPLMTATATGAAAGLTTGTVSFENVPAGYYLIVSDSSDSAYKTDAAMTSGILVAVYGNVTGHFKADSVPTVTKKADKEVDGVLTDQTTIKYTITTQLPANFADYKSYYLKLTDVLPTGLTTVTGELTGENATWGLEITADGKDITKYFTIKAVDKNGNEVTSGTTGTTIVAECTNIVGLEGVAANSDIVMTYTAQLDTDDRAGLFLANADGGGDTNTVTVNFSNNPYTSGEGNTGTGEVTTTETVYDFDLEIVKQDNAENPSPVAGARFELKRIGGVDADISKLRGLTGNIDTSNYTDAGVTINYDTNTVDEKNTYETTTDANGKFAFHGIGEGTYVLTEVSTPEGYKSTDQVVFQVVAEKDAETGEYTGKATFTILDEGSNGNYTELASDAAETKAAVSVETMTVVNEPGTDLPLTGAAGIGAGVVIGGLILTFSAYKAKKNAELD